MEYLDGEFVKDLSMYKRFGHDASKNEEKL